MMGSLENHRQQQLELLKKAVHTYPDFTKYSSTAILDNTNCYSHALGCMMWLDEIYRIGAICGQKPLDQNYFSIKEVETLLFKDMEVLDLKIEKSTFDEVLNENQHHILLYVKLIDDEDIFDFHFLRHDGNDNFWTENVWKRPMKIVTLAELETTYGAKSQFGKMRFKLVGLYKITR